MASPGTATPDRIVELDALRGLAWGFEGSLDSAAWWAGFVLVEDKFRTLFAMLFGAGVAILIERSPGSPWRGHGLRMAVLFVVGIAHATLLASNDILRAYAMAGLLLPAFMRFGSRTVLACAATLVAVHVAGGFIWLRDGLAAWSVGSNGQAQAFFAMNFGTDPAGLEVALERGQEGFGERLDRRLSTIPQTLGAVAASVPLNLATMLVGIVIWRNGLLGAQWSTGRLVRLGAICAAASLPVLVALAAWAQIEGFPGVLVAGNSLVFSAPFDLLLGVAYAALAMALFQSVRDGGAASRLAAVGRLSLTNYLATSLVFSILFASWGLGLFAEVSRATALALSFVPIGLMLLWSPMWLGHFRQGPLEWFWRGLAAGKFAQLRR